LSKSAIFLQSAICKKKKFQLAIRYTSRLQLGKYIFPITVRLQDESKWNVISKHHHHHHPNSALFSNLLSMILMILLARTSGESIYFETVFLEAK
jgi:hypothetical protein